MMILVLQSWDRVTVAVKLFWIHTTVAVTNSIGCYISGFDSDTQGRMRLRPWFWPSRATRTWFGRRSSTKAGGGWSGRSWTRGLASPGTMLGPKSDWIIIPEPETQSYSLLLEINKLNGFRKTGDSICNHIAKHRGLVRDLWRVKLFWKL